MIKKTPKMDAKKSVGVLKTGKTPGGMKTPVGGSSSQTPKPDQKNFKKMMQFLKAQKKSKK